MKKIKIKKEFRGDWISRKAGERLRNIIIEADNEGKSIEIDFENMMIASTSFFDEGIAKLAGLGWTQKKLYSKVKFKNFHKRDLKVLEEMCKNREMQKG